MHKMIPSRLKSLFAFIGVIALVQLVGNLFTMPEIKGWYATLEKPSWTPPNWVFGPVWTILYIMISLSGWILWENLSGSFREKLRHPVMRFYFIQLILNFLWSPLFFGFHMKEIGLIIISAMTIAVAITIKYALSVQRVAAYLLTPYLLWIIYAMTLNAGIVFLN